MFLLVLFLLLMVVIGMTLIIMRTPGQNYTLTVGSPTP